jgi:hypothetical protein
VLRWGISLLLTSNAAPGCDLVDVSTRSFMAIADLGNIGFGNCGDPDAIRWREFHVRHHLGESDAICVKKLIVLRHADIEVRAARAIAGNSQCRIIKITVMANWTSSGRVLIGEIVRGRNLKLMPVGSAGKKKKTYPDPAKP